MAGYGESVSGKRGEIPVQLSRFWRIGRWNEEEKTKPERIGGGDAMSGEIRAGPFRVRRGKNRFGSFSGLR